jgi:hypothetical protein
MTGPRATLRQDSLGFGATIDGVDGVAAFLRGAAKNLPIAVAAGLNRTAEESLFAVAQQMDVAFTIRVPSFRLPRQLPRGDRATPHDLSARVVLFDAAKPFPRGRAAGGENLAQRRGAILSKFETPGFKTAGRLGPVAIPTRRLRPTPTSKIPTQLFPVNLRLGVNRRQADGVTILPALSERRLGKSKRLTNLGLAGREYFVDTRNGVYGIYEKVTDRRGLGAPRAVPPRLIWVFRQSVRIPATLRFYASATKPVETRLVPNIEGALARYREFAASRGA